MLIALAVTQKRHFITFDIAQAYLNADMPDEVYMTLDKLTTRLLVEIDPSYEAFIETNKNGNEEITVKLNKALYGCVQSARLWYNTLSKFLKSIGFEANPVDQGAGVIGGGVDESQKKTTDIPIKPKQLEQEKYKIFNTYINNVVNCFNDYKEQWPFLNLSLIHI